jgi:hypothetical protein
MRPAQKTSPVKLHKGGGPMPRRRQQKKQVLGAFGERVPEVKGGRPPPKGSSAVKQKKLSPAALRRKRARADQLSAFNKASSVGQKKLSPAALKRKRAAGLKLARADQLAAFNKASRSSAKKGTPKEPFNPIDKVRGGRPDPLLRAGRKRQAKKATRTAKPVGDRRVPTATRKATRTAKPVGDRRVPVSRRIPRTATRTAKPVGDRRVPVSRRIRQR